ncbi:unnamed protein product [Anisakis simplex]|uniref:Uncharacterized protein n=1 Tax=Anisakis simplex TaxID=6269 RepID=A0A0M3JVY0_ANISI|nr:unnamed protein product [Anisakis simplex]
MRPCSECVQQTGRISKDGSISECICAQPQQQLQLEHHSPTEHEKHRSNIKPIEERCATMCNPSCQTQCQSLVIQQTHISSTVSLSLKCATICDNLCSAICSPNTAHFSVLISHLKQSLLDSIKQKLMAVISDAQREITPQRLILNRRTLHPDEKEELRELTECISECNDKCIDRCNGLLSALINRCQPQCLERCERVCAVNGTESAKPRDTHSRNQQGNTIRAQENKPLKSTTVSMIFTTTLPTTTTTPTTTPSTTSTTAASKPTTSKPRSTNCNYECRQSNCEETLECSNSNQQYETSTEVN